MLGRRVLRPALALGLALALTSCSRGETARPTDERAPSSAAFERAPEPTTPAVEPPSEASPSSPTEERADPPSPPPDDGWVLALLEAHPKKFGRLLEDPARWRLQILVTEIIPPEGASRRERQRQRAAEGWTLTEHGYRVDVEYVYPASAIKTFASVAALKKLASLRAQGRPVDLDTPMALCAEASERCGRVHDSSNLDGGHITLGHEIRKMQLVSNNEAFNRLYDFVGHRELNELIWGLGLSGIRVHHRMYDDPDPEGWRRTPRIELRPRGAEAVVIPARRSDLELPPTPTPGLKIGVAYLDQDKQRVDEPLDFSQKNWVSLRVFHALALSLARPELPGAVELGIEEKHRAFLLQAMTEDPLASKNPVYTSPKKSGLRYHTMIQGIMRALPLERIRYVGKAGRAFGFHLDNAYIEDRKTGRAMVVSAAIYANSDGVLNDDRYGYDPVTRPFLKDLGEVLARAVLLAETP